MKVCRLRSPAHSVLLKTQLGHFGASSKQPFVAQGLNPKARMILGSQGVINQAVAVHY